MLIQIIILKLRNTRDEALKQVRHDSAGIAKVFEKNKHEAEADLQNLEKHYGEKQRKIIDDAKDEFKKFTKTQTNMKGNL